MDCKNLLKHLMKQTYTNSLPIGNNLPMKSQAPNYLTKIEASIEMGRIPLVRN